MSRGSENNFKVTDKKNYDLDFKKQVKTMDSSNLLAGDKITAFYKEHIDAYTIVTIEDSFYQYDWDK